MADIHAGHRQRLKENFRKSGLDSFQAHNILELLLFYAVPRQDTNLLAHELIEKFGSVSGVLNAPYDELIKIKGLGENGATLFRLIPELLSLYTIEENSTKTMDNANTVCNYFHGCYIGVKTEQLRVCCLDDKLNVISNTIIEDGGVNAVSINVRKIVEATFRSNASLIILAHNHPNGEALPSDADIKVTRQLHGILESVGIKLLDHIIVGKKNAISMKNNGYFNIFE